MALVDLKFKESDFVGQDVSSLPNQVRGQAEFVKGRMDNVAKNMIALGRFNDLIDAIEAEVFKKTGGQISGAVSIVGKVAGSSFGIYGQTAEIVFNPSNRIFSTLNANGWAALKFILENGNSIEANGLEMKLVTQGGVHSQDSSSAYLPFYGSAFTQVSSESGKENIVPYTGALEKINAANIYSYDKKADGMKQIGMVIEDETTPEEVIVNGVQNKRARSTNGGAQYIDLYSLISMTAQSVKELKAEKDEEITALRNENAGLKALLVSKGVCTQEEIENL
ncbi:MAG: hypothetical protein VB081_12610 [Christensenella sp.]|uniref:tail fiber domain-containing protein n=1 Tax=Christensenella sp. TaxID=1935934 RepID=UPI002B1FC7F0|nr:tail fiber domain-containing protein [Christensenella sp.]MEA5004321.1 hypothetical protein [Christensenella sp.]